MSHLFSSFLSTLYVVIYSPLHLIHFTAPVHPVLAHFAIGTIGAAFIFDYLGWIFRREVLFTTARHSIVFGAVSFLLTGLAGLADWGHRYRMASLAAGANKIAFAFGMKYLLSGILFVAFIGLFIVLARTEPKSPLRHLFYLLCFVCVIGLGFYGGRVIYG